MTWRPADSPRRPKPTFQPIVRDVALTDAEQARLAMLRAVYPYIEYTDTRQQMNRLMLLKWEFGTTKDL